MKWKKVFFAGAVLILTACNTSTAPTSPSALNARTLSSVKSDDSTAVTAPTLPTPQTSPSTDCSMVIRVGDIDVPVLICVPTTTIAW